MVGVLHPVIHVFERPVVNLSSGENGVCFAPDDRSGKGLNLVGDDDMTRRLQIREERSPFRIRQRSRLSGSMSLRVSVRVSPNASRIVIGPSAGALTSAYPTRFPQSSR